MNRLLIAVDGNSLMHRAFHAIGDLDDAHGNPTNALYGFAGMLLKVLLDRQPTHLAVAFDMHGPTFRHERYADYKGTRPPTDERLRPQFPRVKALLRAMGAQVIEVPRYEADDILGALAARCEAEGMPALLVTGDRDALQLVSEKTHVLYTKRGISDTVEFTPEAVLTQYGVTPSQIPDLKGLMGDSSDNIPGVPGVGEKTAVKLLTQYGTLAEALAHADEQKGKLRERLIEHHDLAEESLWLATIVREAPLPVGLDACALQGFAGAKAAFDELGFPSLAPRVAQLVALYGGDKPIEEKPSNDWGAAMPYADLIKHPPLALHPGDDLSLAGTAGWAVLPVQRDLLSEGLSLDEAYAALDPLFQGENTLAVFDGKGLLHALDSMGMRRGSGCIAEDALLAGWLIAPHKPPKSLAALAGEGADARALWDTIQTQKAALADLGMESLYRDVELPLMRVLLDMEREGFLVDRAELAKLGEKFAAREGVLREEIIALTGGIPFNLNSPKQLGEVLFERLALPHGRKTKSGYSTDADTLEGLRDLHPAIGRLLEYRQVSKLNATYIEGLLAQIEGDGRIRSRFDQTATVTGRLSSNEPNLQNIPVRTEMGRDIRRAFIARPGWVLVDADYSQIELRILAHLSGDPAMIDAFLSGQDIHARTAAEVYGVPMDQVTAQMRSASKAVNFGIVYGISDFGLARNIGISRAEAADFIARYFDRYPGVRRFMDQAVAEGRALGYARTLLGRRRPLPELESSNYNTRAFGERAAMNTPVQGAAADIIKLAMVRVHEELRQGGFSARLILQVHDELIVEAPAAEAPRVAALLRRCMEGVAALSVPLVADVHQGRSWFEAK
ncbi:MAG: DNA polymerase I [Oscillospiraceae bacterium]|jgi:DNA polymerase-1|nr:DNA polymerase I [Oscillospiraceae bacterium]